MPQATCLERAPRLQHRKGTQEPGGPPNLRRWSLECRKTTVAREHRVGCCREEVQREDLRGLQTVPLQCLAELSSDHHLPVRKLSEAR